MSINPSGARIYFRIFGFAVTGTVLSYLIVTVILCTAGILLGKNLKKRPGRTQALTEKAVQALYKLVTDNMGEHNAHWAPFIGTIFLSSVLGSYIGLTGFLRATTADVSVVGTWAVMVSGITWYQSIKANGFGGWLKGFTEPIAVMTPMNIVSEFAQPVSMAFRHFGNVAGGGVITSVLYAGLSVASAALLRLVASSGVAVTIAFMALGAGLLALGIVRRKTKRKIFGVILFVIGFFGLLQALDILTGVPILQVGIPAILSLYFDIFSGVIQAFVFCMLTMIYIAGACPAPETEKQSA